MLKFPDDTQVSVFGLDEILAELYADGSKANDMTAQEIITKLEAINNYIPSSDSVRREYRHVLLNEYRKYVKSQTDSDRQ